jgi:hypothetical protein
MRLLRALDWHVCYLRWVAWHRYDDISPEQKNTARARLFRTIFRALLGIESVTHGIAYPE